MSYTFVGLIRWAFCNSPGSAETVVLTPMLGIQLIERDRTIVGCKETENRKLQWELAAVAVAKVNQKKVFLRDIF